MELLIKGSFWERVVGYELHDLNNKSFIMKTHCCNNLYKITSADDKYVYLKCYKNRDEGAGHKFVSDRSGFSRDFRLVSLPTIETKRWASKANDLVKMDVLGLSTLDIIEKDLLISGIVRKCINSKMNIEDCFYKIVKDY